MGFIFLEVAFTVASFITFLGIIAWAVHPLNRGKFEHHE